MARELPDYRTTPRCIRSVAFSDVMTNCFTSHRITTVSTPRDARSVTRDRQVNATKCSVLVIFGGAFRHVYR